MNEQRKKQAPIHVKEIEAAAASIGLKLPSKTKELLLEGFRGLTSMQRFIAPVEETREVVDDESWADLVQRDPLAAELEAIGRTTAKNKARM